MYCIETNACGITPLIYSGLYKNVVDMDCLNRNFTCACLLVVDMRNYMVLKLKQCLFKHSYPLLLVFNFLVVKNLTAKLTLKINYWIVQGT